MLQKMYMDNMSEARDVHAKGEYAEGVKPKKLDFQFYWRAFNKKRWPILVFTALMTVAAIYYSLTATPIYAANTALLLEAQKANIISIEDLISTEQESNDYYGTQFATLRSRAVAERALRKLELDDNISPAEVAEMLAPSKVPQLFKSLGRGFGKALSVVGLGEDTVDTDNMPVPPSADPASTGAGNVDEFEGHYRTAEFERILGLFRQSLTISPVAKTKLVSIVFESTDPEFSALAANTIADQYIESVLERRNKLEDKASDWMDRRIAEIKLELDESEETLLLFKKANGLVELDGGVSRLDEQELLLKNSELTAAESELSKARDLYRKIQLYKDSSPQLLETLPLVQADLLVRAVKTEVGQAQRDLVEAKNRYGDRHPNIIDAESRLESLRTTLNGHIERLVATFESDYQQLQQRVQSLDASVAQYKENIQVIGQQKISLEALEREVDSYRGQYDRLYDRITETRTADGLEEANAVVAEAAWAPVDPVKPNKKFIIGVVVLFSLLISATVAFVLEYLDDTVNSKDDIERRLKTKLLGVLPIVEHEPRRQEKPVPLTPVDVRRKSETFSEAINTCRTSLSVSNIDNLQVILVTSSVPDEGKSTVALNLAASFGRLGRTMLVDCDLRRPSIANALGLSPTRVGLTSVLQRKSPGCVLRGVMDSFDCLTSGPVPDHPLEMLSSVKFAKLIRILRRHYDRIIIDSAPTHVVSDALVLSKLSDGVLYVVKPHTTSIDLIDSGLSRLVEAGASVAGVCISQLDINKPNTYDGFEFHGFGTAYHGDGTYDDH